MKWRTSSDGVKTVKPGARHNYAFGGGQVRSYVLQPYTLAKDLRTEHETQDVYAVLDGDLDQFLLKSLESRVGQT